MFDTSYTLQQIAEATGFSSERVRYVIDQKIMPGQRKSGAIQVGSRGRGKARRYIAFEAFSIACATAMIGAGLRRKTVRECFDLICSYTRPGSRNVQDMPLYQAFERDVAMLEIGDHVNVRIHGSADYRKRKLDFGWRQIETGAALGDDYEPTVIVGINVAKIRKSIR